MITNTWQKNSSLPADAVISGISSSRDSSETGPGNLWVCSTKGLFFEKEGVFQPPVGGIPFTNASAVLALDKTVLAAGYPNHLILSTDGSRTWFSSRLERITSAVTCFAASPDFNRDGVVLAGTDGDGILRSTDSGNSWELSNFGLRSLNVLGLACAPAWRREVAPNFIVSRYEIIFAATEEGVYMSPNAGRAWHSAGDGLPPAPILSISVSPNFKRTFTTSNAIYTGAVFAGTDGAGLYRSMDGGQSWQIIASLSPEMTVNTMCFDSQGKLYLGTSEHGILVSSDLGETWSSLLETEDVILCLAADSTRLLAGTAENGLFALDW